MRMHSTDIREQKRIFYFDCIRALACIFVVAIHVSTKYVEKYTGWNFLVGNFFDSLGRPAVPLFVMLSGALWLDEEYHFEKKKWLWHIGKMIVFFLFWSAIHCLAFDVVRPLKDGLIPDAMQIVKDFIQGWYHLWFVPMIIGLYSIIPILRLWVKKQNIRYIEYYLILSAIFSFVLPQLSELLKGIHPALDSFCLLLSGIHMQHLQGYVFYFVLGWYLRSKEMNGRIIYISGLAGLFLTFAGTQLMQYMGKKDFSFYSGFSVNVGLYSAAIFSLCKNSFEKRELLGSMFGKTVRVISKYSLGVYAMHVIMMEFIFNELFVILPALAAILVITAASVIASIILSAIIKRIPLLKTVV